MNSSVIITLMFLICLYRLLVVTVATGVPASMGNGQHPREHTLEHPKPLKEEPAAMLQAEPAHSAASKEDLNDMKLPPSNNHSSTARNAAVEGERRAVDAYDSGLKGTTSSVVMSGVPGGQGTGRLTSLEFAIAPIEGGKPAYQKAIFVKSDHQGRYTVALPPGIYWIGPKAKALDPINYRPGAVVFPEQEVVVKEEVFTQLDLVEVGYAP
jgi:hypothetical protein